jgi:hypothetical protein
LFTFNIGALSAETTTLGTKENPYNWYGIDSNGNSLLDSNY